MFDPRWDDSRDRGDDVRERAYEGRDQTGDPRDVFLHDVDLPLDRDREYVLDRDQIDELNGDESHTLATVGAFRVVPERDLLDGDDAQRVSNSLDHLREQGLIETVPIGDRDQGWFCPTEAGTCSKPTDATDPTATVGPTAMSSKSSDGR